MMENKHITDLNPELRIKRIIEVNNINIMKLNYKNFMLAKKQIAIQREMNFYDKIIHDLKIKNQNLEKNHNVKI